MKSLIAFIKKELTEQIRLGRFMIAFILFAALGIMNPAVAKLTPWFYEIFADSLAESGVIITAVEVSAMDSWVQFFKNIPIGLIAFVLIYSGIFTKEYLSGTLVLSLTKGLKRRNVVISKALILGVTWTALYWMCFGITYVYNAYFWDNSVAKNLGFSTVCWWIFGLFIISLTVIFSTLASSNIGVLGGVGAITLASYLVGLIPKVNKYLPTFLTDGTSLIYGVLDVNEYTWAIVITVFVSAVCFILSISAFNKKQL